MVLEAATPPAQGPASYPSDSVAKLRRRPASARRGSHGRVVVLAALLALAAGLWLYLLDRTPGSAYLLSAAWSLHQPGHSGFGRLGGVLPAFLHTYAFALLTAWALGAGRRAATQGCLVWLGINALLEIGQHPAISSQIAAAVPAGFAGVPLLENLARYFTRGTFDPWDLAAIAAGALLAYFTLALPGDQRHETP
jgi:hypothetical protein